MSDDLSKVECSGHSDACTGNAEPAHTCPYLEDVCGDMTECNCCEACTEECGMDI